jgi:hypothetical protein
MGIVLLSLEVGVAMPVKQLRQASSTLRTARRHFPDENITLTHTFYANIGGFRFIIAKDKDSTSIETAGSVSEIISLPHSQQPCFDHGVNQNQNNSTELRRENPSEKRFNSKPTSVSFKPRILWDIRTYIEELGTTDQLYEDGSTLQLISVAKEKFASKEIPGSTEILSNYGKLILHTPFHAPDCD